MKIINHLKFFAAALGFSLILVTSAAFGDENLSWKDAVAESKKNHPDLVSAQAKVAQSKADESVAVSNLYPQITGSLGADTSKRPSSSERADSYSYGISGRQLLFDGFKTYFDIQRAAKTLESSSFSYEVTSSNVRLRLRTAFVDMLKAQELVSLTQQIAKRRRLSRDLIQLLYKAGREDRGALLTAEANLAQADYEIEEAMRSVGLAQAQLTKELGRARQVPVKAVGDFSIADKAQPKPDFESLAAQTPLLLGLIVQREAARWGVDSSIASFLPQVYATGSEGKSSSDWPPSGREWSGGLALTMPIFEGGNLVASATKSKAFFRQTQADERSGRDTVLLTLNVTWTKFQNTMGQTDVDAKFVQADTERAKIATKQYATGLITFNDWIIIENNLVSTQKTYLNDQAATLLAEAVWQQAKGETLNEE